MPRSVREPIQVYLTSEERRVLDEAARTLGVSRSEVLRRGLRAVGTVPTGPAQVSAEVVITPAAGRRAQPPPSLPVAPLEELLAELSKQREDR